MKKLLLIYALIIVGCIYSWGQIHSEDVIISDNSFSIVSEGNLPKKTKFHNAREWIAKTYGDYKSVLQLEDEGICKIIIKGISPLLEEQDDSFIYYYPSLSYSLTIDCKDDRYRIRFENIKIDVKYIYRIPNVRTIVKHYSYDEYVLAKEFDGCSYIDILKTELDSLKSIPSSSMRKKELKAHQERVLRKEKEYNEKLDKENKKKAIIEKRSVEVKSALAAIVNSISASINADDDF